jgi:outer membrane murein-binding lipoprotein Lpp
MRLRFVPWLLAALLGAAALAGCSSDTQSKIDKAVDGVKKDVDQQVDKLRARGAAEAIRVKLLVDTGTDDQKNITAQEVDAAVKDASDDVKVTRSTSDSKVVYLDVAAGKERACVTVPATGHEVEVTSGSCPATNAPAPA